MSRGKKSDVKKDADYLPSHVGEAFLKDLDSLVDQLGSDYGFKGRYLRQEFRSKYCDSTTVSPEVRRQAAIDKFMATEERNSLTNMRILLGDTDFGWTTSDELITTARQIIVHVLGHHPAPTIFSVGKHSNGASTRVKRGPQASFLKHVGKAHGSTTALLLHCLAHTGTMLAEQELVVQESSVLFTVPKSSDIDRVACKEPEINMLLQRSIGAYIGRRLKKTVGIDLRDQRINQSLARDALKLGLATIDLSSASDSISRQLVISLLPIDWWDLMDRVRVHSTIIDGELHELEMFSSMGNGFTFELESLIFYALTRAVAYRSGVKGRISVYGDDIIAPSVIGARLARVFNWFGFKVNTKKSNWRGLFRESCGKHYYAGREVTPFYVREPVTRKSHVIRLLNRLLIWAADGWYAIGDPEIALFHAKWAAIIPRDLWGGQDPERIDALVTGDLPRSRLFWRARDLPREEVGAYIHWHTARRETNTSPIDSGDPRIPLELDPSVRLRAVKLKADWWGERTKWTPYLYDWSSTCGNCLE